MLREMVAVEGLAIPACAGGETPHFLLGLGLKKCWMIVAVLFVIFRVSFDNLCPFIASRLLQGCSLPPVCANKHIPLLARGTAESAALPGAARRDSSMCACLAGLTSGAGAGSSSHGCIPQHVPW